MSLKLIELKEKDCEPFITLSGEEMLIAKRKHPFVGLGRILVIMLLGSLTLVGGNLIIYLVVHSQTLSLTFSSLVIISILSVLVKSIVDWYYYIYIFTTRKILEICCIPLFSDYINDVFLDQVRTTEINAKMGTFLHELLDMGDVRIAFDRPSHEQVLILRNIHNPREVATFLGNKLEEGMAHSPVWFKQKEAAQIVKVSEDIYPAMES